VARTAATDGEQPFTQQLKLLPTESLAELIVQSVTSSALKTSITKLGSNSSDFDVRATATATGPGEQTATLMPPLSSNTESMAELVVQSVTASALQQYGCSPLRVDRGKGKVGGLKSHLDDNRAKINSGNSSGGDAPDRTLPHVAQEKNAAIEASVRASTEVKAPPRGEIMGAKATENMKHSVGASGPRTSIREFFNGYGGRGKIHTSEETSQRLQDIEGAHATNTTVEDTDHTVSNNDGDCGNMATTFDAARKAESRSKDPSHEYSSDSFEDEEAEDVPIKTTASSSRNGVTETSSDDLDGYSRGRAEPQQLDGNSISAIASASCPLDAREELPQAKVGAEEVSSPRLEELVCQIPSSLSLTEVRIEQGDGESDSCLFSDHLRRTSSTREADTRQQEPPSADTISAAKGGTASYPPTLSSAAGPASQTSAGGASGLNAMPASAGAVSGLEELSRDVSAWFDNNVLAPSTATAIAILKDQDAGSSAKTFPSTSFDPEVNVGNAGDSSFGGGATSFNSGTSATASAAQDHPKPGAGTPEVRKEGHAGWECRNVHPARLFHLLWERDR